MRAGDERAREDCVTVAADGAAMSTTAEAHDGREEDAPQDGEAAGCDAGNGMVSRVARTRRDFLSRPRKGKVLRRP